MELPEKNVSLIIWVLLYVLAKQDQNSVRSSSPGIADEINKEIELTRLRLNNIAG